MPDTKTNPLATDTPATDTAATDTAATASTPTATTGIAVDDLGDLRQVLECAEQTPAGLSFYPPDDLVMRESADSLAPQPGYLVVDLHGTAERAKVGPRWLDAEELATVLKACDAWDGRPIFLMCCDSGRRSDGFAQQLADQLGTEVKAPDKLAWSDFEPGGRAQPYSSDGFLDAFGLPRPIKPPTGTFVTFTPRDRVEPQPGAERETKLATDHGRAAAGAQPGPRPDPRRVAAARRGISLAQQGSGRPAAQRFAADRGTSALGDRGR